MSQNSDAVEKVRGGNLNTLNFLVGQTMRETKGKGDPKRIREIILRLTEETR
ncbi:MAG: hypothetical protein ACK4WB_08375 [Desulfatiglandales bacterium]